ncbi:signal peptidase I [Clostridium sp.]|uniref:signal peptidase I n=1 Tax=Clostridium sp. TaxID=1506 RepID=UPI003F301D97
MEEYRKEKSKIIPSILFYSLIIFILVGSTVFSLSKNKNKSIFGFRFYNVLTSSMEPAIKSGDLVLTKITDSKNIEVGDIITFYPSVNPDAYLTHRVIEKAENYNDSGLIGFKTKGDNNESADNMVVSEKKVVGVVEFVIPYLGFIISYISQNIILIISLVLLIVIWAKLVRYFCKK